MVFFFVKHKTAYEVRIRDCSSDVCSSYLYPAALSHRPKRLLETAPARQLQHMVGAAPIGKPAHRVGPIGRMAAKDTLPGPQCLDLFDFLVASRYDELGRASCRDRVCQ